METTKLLPSSPWAAPAPRALIARVTAVDTVTGRMVTRAFADSPVRIGSRADCDLRLRRDGGVAGRHGEIVFHDGVVHFRSRARTHATAIDDWCLARGEAVALSGASVIALGRYRIDVALCPAAIRGRERSRKVTPLVLLAPPPATRATQFKVVSSLGRSERSRVR